MVKQEKSQKTLPTHFVSDWDHSKNLPVSLADVTANTRQSFWWTCQTGHSYKVSPYTRLRTNGCKFCNQAPNWESIKRERLSNGTKSRLSEKGSIALLDEWAHDLNKFGPDQIASGSNEKVNWRCPKGHTWRASPKSRMRGTGCPICAIEGIGARVREYKLKQAGGSLAAEHPLLMTEWDFEKNTLDPTKLTSGSNAKVFWKCRFGHSWSAAIYNRTGNESNCPLCSNQSSRLEIFLLCELRFIFKAVSWRSKFEGVEADLFLPDFAIVIEIDGEYWHRDKLQADRSKSEFFRTRGMKLLRVRSSKLASTGDPTVTFDTRHSNIEVTLDLVKLLAEFVEAPQIGEYLESGMPHNEEEYKKILARLPAPPESESLASLYPEVAAQWSIDKNAPLTPDLFTPYSDQKFWWRCSEQHSWEATIKNRTLRGSGCPVCYRESNRKHPAAQLGSISDERPDLVGFWDHMNNHPYTCNDIAISSSKSVQWICDVGHSFNRSPTQMAKDTSCPACESFLFRFPELALEWDKEKNQSLNPIDFTPGSAQTIWWRCSEKKHSFSATIAARTGKHATGCPICWKVRQGVDEALALARYENALISIFNPALVVLWDEAKNPPDVSPTLITVNDKNNYWWKCPNSHRFQQSAFSMARGYRCPRCSALEVIESNRIRRLTKFGTLLDNHPTLASKWHPTKNGELTPDMIGSNSHLLVWWRCPEGHEFQQKPNHLVTLITRGSKYFCPYCGKTNQRSTLPPRTKSSPKK